MNLVNAERARAGLPALRVDACLTAKAAEPWARHLADTQSMTHQNLSAVLATCPGGSVGENVAVGQPTASAVVQAWMNSSGHRANILNPSYTRIGVADVVGADGRHYWVQVFEG